MKTLAQVKSVETACSCRTCQGMCEDRPCWPTPTEALAISAAGFGDRLMADYWEGDLFSDGYSNIKIISPAVVGHEGQHAPWSPEGRCTFLNSSGLCELHDLGLKPTEGRLAHHSRIASTDGGVHEAVAESWNNAEGQKIAREWERVHNL